MPAKTDTTTITKSDIHEGLEVARKARKAPVTAKAKTPAPKADTPVLLTAAQVARDNGLDGRRFRAFLRAMDIDRRFPTQASATKAVKAFQKAIAAKASEK